MPKALLVNMSDVHDICRHLARLSRIVASDGRMSRENKIAANTALRDCKKIAGTWVQLSLFSSAQLIHTDPPSQI